MNGTVSGLDFTAGTITQSLSLGNVLLALLPFITCFGAIALNCLKKRWWVLGSIALIVLGLWFFMHTNSLHAIGLQHAPEVTPDNDLGEGFSIIGLGIGHKLSFALTDVRKEFNRLESNLHRSHRAKQQTPPAAPPVEENTAAKPAEEEDKEDPSRFMPKNSGL